VASNWSLNELVNEKQLEETTRKQNEDHARIKQEFFYAVMPSLRTDTQERIPKIDDRMSSE